ncbi:MAG: cupin domain-containing protein [Pseudomonadota bacterium]
MKITDFRSLLDNGSSEESHELVAFNGRELQELVNPISCEEFVNSYFSRASLNVEGHPEKFDHIFSWEKLRQALARGQSIQDRRYNLTASFAGGEESGSSRRMMAAHHDQVIELLNAGATICITNIHMADPFLARWAQEIRAQLNFTGTVGVNCYVSADGSGLPMHYDKRVATTLQIAGKKRWRFSTESAKAWPDTNEVYQEGQVGENVGKLPADMEFREVELNPGDMLCLPAGAWHSARGVGFSLALNLYFAPRNLLDQFIPLLQHFAVSNENWRGGPPATVEKTQGNMPKAVSVYMRERLDEFHKMALEAIDSPDALVEPWLTSLTHAPYTGWRPDPMLSIPEVTPNQQFRVAMSSLRFIEFQDKLIVPCDSGLLRFPVTFAPILQRLSSCSASFTISDVLSWQQKPDSFSPNEIMSYLKMLYQNGILKKL